MKVCDGYPDRKAIDSFSIHGMGTQIDVCNECREAVLAIFAKPPDELGESPLAPPKGDASQKAPKRGLSFSGKQ